MLRNSIQRGKTIVKQLSVGSFARAPVACSAVNYRQLGTHKEADPTELIKDIVHSAVTLAGEVSFKLVICFRSCLCVAALNVSNYFGIIFRWFHGLRKTCR